MFRVGRKNIPERQSASAIDGECVAASSLDFHRRNAAHRSEPTVVSGALALAPSPLILQLHTHGPEVFSGGVVDQVCSGAPRGRMGGPAKAEAGG